MSTEKIGANLRAEDSEARSFAAQMLGSVRTERKTATSRANAAKATEARRGKPMTEEHKAKLRQAYLARREAQGITTEAKQARPVGRPRKEPPADGTTTPKRGRGRPRKSEVAQMPLPNADVAQTGE